MKKILFLHGFFATGSCPMARALKEAFEGTAVVLTPDLPLHPKEALMEIRSIIEREQPDLLLGNSCGSFLAQMLAPVVGIPALLGNPYFMMTEFLKERIGEHEYKAPRRDGNQRLVIDEALIEEFAELEAVQFDHCNPYYKDRVWGLFGEQDTLAHFSPLFLEHYNQAFHFPGGHTPTEQEVKTWYAPLAQKMMMEFSAKEERYFQHFRQIQVHPFCLRLRDSGAHGGLSGSLWRTSLLGSPGKYVLRKGNEGWQNFQSFHGNRQIII